MIFIDICSYIMYTDFNKEFKLKPIIYDMKGI